MKQIKSKNSIRSTIDVEQNAFATLLFHVTKSFRTRFPLRKRGEKIRFYAMKLRLEQFNATYPLASISGGCQVHRNFSQECDSIVRMLTVGMPVYRIHRNGLLLLHFQRLAAASNLWRMQQSH